MSVSLLGGCAKNTAAPQAPLATIETVASADASYTAGRYDDAFKNYRAVYKRSDLNPELVRGMAKAKLAAADMLGPGEGASDADWAIVVEGCDRLMSRGALDALTARECGRSYLMRGDAQPAAQALGVAVQGLPSDGEAHSAYAAALGATGRLGDAVRHATRATELKPESASAFGNLGALLMLSSQPKSALTAYSRALQLEPEIARRHADVGSARVLLGDHAAGVQAYEKAISLEPGRASFYASLGFARLGTGDGAGALSACEKATQLDARSVPGWVNLAVVHARAKRFAEARAALAYAENVDAADVRVKQVREELAAAPK